MNYMHIYNETISDGVGIRVSLYVSGCRNKCKGCHNPESWDFCYGKPFTVETEDEILQLLKNPLIDGLTICGGEPMEEENQEGILDLLVKVKQNFPNKNIWCYTGYEFADLLADGKKHIDITDKILSLIDVMVVGPFILELRDISSNNPWRGSTNQRVIDVQKSLKENRLIPLPWIINNDIEN